MAKLKSTLTDEQQARLDAIEAGKQRLAEILAEANPSQYADLLAAEGSRTEARLSLIEELGNHLVTVREMLDALAQLDLTTWSEFNQANFPSRIRDTERRMRSRIGAVVESLNSKPNNFQFYFGAKLDTKVHSMAAMTEGYINQYVQMLRAAELAPPVQPTEGVPVAPTHPSVPAGGLHYKVELPEINFDSRVDPAELAARWEADDAEFEQTKKQKQAEEADNGDE